MTPSQTPKVNNKGKWKANSVLESSMEDDDDGGNNLHITNVQVSKCSRTTPVMEFLLLEMTCTSNASILEWTNLGMRIYVLWFSDMASGISYFIKISKQLSTCPMPLECKIIGCGGSRIQSPGINHLALTVQNCLASGGHFLSYLMMHLTELVNTFNYSVREDGIIRGLVLTNSVHLSLNWQYTQPSSIKIQEYFIEGPLLSWSH
ncbi:hypothetical protein HD554DRAFT_2038931 [Boletus coccyginus]|nr:hypothetical protein HD554DRAFT_2038931 [Boletus coccyginus]